MKADDEFIPTRQSLLSRLKDLDDQESWRVFFDTYWTLIYNAAMKSGLNDAEAQDVVQETVISVLGKIQKFEYDPEKGSFKGWLLRLTKWRIGDQLRKRQRGIEQRVVHPDTFTMTDNLEEMEEPGNSELDRIWDAEWENNLLRAAIRRVKKKVDDHHYQLFDLLVFRGWSVLKVAQTMKVNPGLVYLVKHRVGGVLKKEIAHLRVNMV